MREMKIVKLL